MNFTKIVTKRVDDVEKIVIPKQVQRALGVRKNDTLKFCVDEQKGLIILQRIPSVKDQ